ncbi:MAG: 4Fe-4S dicluster domain-containing protein, partial [Asticcacaulis sp.]
KQGEGWEGRGHCIDCSLCVAVCPAGIDIRDGLQFNCISCGLCIDACNSVMDKLMLPRGLIRYDTETNQNARRAAIAAGAMPPKGKMRWIRPRTVFYAAIMCLVGSLMLGAILMRTETDLNIIHNRSPLYVRLSNGDIRNNYQLKVLNKSHFDRDYVVSVSGMPVRSVTLLAAGDAPVKSFTVAANSIGEFRAELVTPSVTPSGAVAAGNRTPITFTLTDRTTGKIARHVSYFIRP